MGLTYRTPNLQLLGVLFASQKPNILKEFKRFFVLLHFAEKKE